MNPLTYDQVRQLTGKVYPAVQKRELDRLGIPAKRRSDGSVLVLESTVNSCLGVLASAKLPTSKEEPRWGALRDSDKDAGKVEARTGKTQDRGNSSVYRSRKVVPMPHARTRKAVRNSGRDSEIG